MGAIRAGVGGCGSCLAGEIPVGCGAARRGSRRCCSRRMRRIVAAVHGTPNYTPFVKDAFHRYLINGRNRRGESGGRGHEGGGALQDRFAAGRPIGASAATVSAGRSAGGTIRRRNSSGYFNSASPRRMNFMTSRLSKTLPADMRQHRPAGLRGIALVEAVLSLHRAGMADGRSRTADAAGVAMEWAEPRMAASVQPRRDFHAGQMGISVVRGVGSGVSHDHVCHDRSGICQGAAHSAAARMVHASQRAIAGV